MANVHGFGDDPKGDEIQEMPIKILWQYITKVMEELKMYILY